MPAARIMQSSATREPTEKSTPPVTITQVMPQTMQIRAALVRKISRIVWSLVKPLYPYSATPRIYSPASSASAIRIRRVWARRGVIPVFPTVAAVLPARFRRFTAIPTANAAPASKSSRGSRLSIPAAADTSEFISIPSAPSHRWDADVLMLF